MSVWNSELQKLVSVCPSLGSLIALAESLEIEVPPLESLPSVDEYAYAIQQRTFPMIPPPSKEARGGWSDEGLKKSMDFYILFGVSSQFGQLARNVVLHTKYRRLNRSNKRGISKNFHKSADTSQRKMYHSMFAALNKKNLSLFTKEDRNEVDGYYLHDGNLPNGQPLQPFQKRWLMTVAKRGSSSGHKMPVYHPPHKREDLHKPIPDQYSPYEEKPEFVPWLGVNPPKPPIKPPFAPDIDRCYRASVARLPRFLQAQIPKLGKRPKDHFLCANGAAVLCIYFRRLKRMKSIQEKAFVFWGKANYHAQYPRTSLGALLAESICSRSTSSFITSAGVVPSFDFGLLQYPLLDTDKRFNRFIKGLFEQGVAAETQSDKDRARSAIQKWLAVRNPQYRFRWDVHLDVLLDSVVTLDNVGPAISPIFDEVDPEGLEYQSGTTDTLSAVFDISLFFVQLRSCSNWSGIAALVISTLRRFSVPFSFIQTFVGDYSGLAYQTTFASTIAGAFTEAYDAFVASELGVHLAKVISTFSIVGVLGALGIAGTAEQWKLRVANLEPLLVSGRNTALETLVSRTIRLVRVFYERLSEAFARGDLSILWGGTRTLSDWMDVGRCVLDEQLLNEPNRISVVQAFERKMAAGEFPSSINKLLSRNELIDLIDTLVKDADALIAFYCENTVVLRNIEVRVAALKHRGAHFKRQVIDGCRRIPPLGLFFSGTTGLGKTSIVNLIHRSIAQRMDWEKESSGMHHVSLTANFPVYNSGQWHCVADDIDNVAVAAGSPNHYSFVLDTINDKPMNIEAAAIEDKGRMWASFGLFSYLTNHDSGNFANITNSSAPFWRRFTFSIKVFPKPRFCHPGTTCLDPERIEEHTSDLWDRIEVHKLDLRLMEHRCPTDPSPFVLFKSFNSLPQFLSWIATEFEERHKAKREAADKQSEADCCSRCALPIFDHADSVECQSLLLGFLSLAGFWYVTPIIFNFVLNYWNKFHEYLMVEWDKFLLTTIPNKVLGGSTYGEFLWAQTAAAYRRHYARIVNRSLLLGGSLTTIIGSLYLLYQHYNSMRVVSQGLTSESNPVPQGIPSRDNWVRVPVQYTRPYASLPGTTWSLSDLQQLLQESLLKFQYGNSVVWGIHLKQNCFLLPWHFFGTTPNGIETLFNPGHKVRGFWNGAVFETLVTELSVMQVPGRDLAILYAPEAVHLNRSVWTKMAAVDIAAPELVPDALTLIRGADVATLHRGVTSVSKYGSRAIDHHMWEYEIPTENGDCGSPVIIHRANGFYLSGMHVACRGGKYGVGESISQQAISPTLTKLLEAQSVQPVDNMVYQDRDLTIDPPIFGELPLKSSLWAQLSSPQPVQVTVRGTVLNFRSTRFKSEVVNMPEWERWEHLSRKHCGEFPVAYRPSPKGRMSDGYWMDPFTVNLTGADNTSGDPRIWRLAVDDYLHGADELHYLDSIRPLSLNDAFLGLQGTDIGGTALSTSVGPPYNGPKRKYMEFDHTDRVVFIDPAILDHYDRILEVVKRGDAYSPVCNYILKDEPISLAKVEACKVRAFTVLPFAFNLLLKQYFGPLMNLCRHHCFFFETAIGMNACGPEWTKLHDWLSDFPHWGAADNSFFDVKESTHEAIAVIDLMLRLCRMCNYTEEELTICRGLLFGCVYTTRVIKGDVFYASFMMSTGFWLTILINTFRNCLQRRYCFIYLRPDPNLIFREGIHQMTLGDDNVSTTIWPWFHQKAIQAASREFGGVVTDAHKRLDIALFEDPSEVTFLKRSFVRRGDVVLAPIEIKTLIKMATLRIRNKNLMECDHACTLYSNIMAEAWMHGEEVFNEFRSVIDEIIAERGYHSIFLKLEPYERYVTAHAANQLSTWDPASNFL